MMSQTITGIVTSAPTTATMVVSVQPSGAPPASLTNPNIQFVVNGGSFSVAAQLVSTSSPCVWSSVSAVVCTLTGLSGATQYQFQAILASTQTYSATSSLSTPR